jgi:hypothetical protein
MPQCRSPWPLGGGELGVVGSPWPGSLGSLGSLGSSGSALHVVTGNGQEFVLPPYTVSRHVSRHRCRLWPWAGGSGSMPERRRCGLRCDAATTNGTRHGRRRRPAVSVVEWWAKGSGCLQLRRRFALFLDAFWKTSSPKACPCAVPASGRRSSCSASPSSAPEPTCSQRHRTAASLLRAPTRAPLHPLRQQLHSSSHPCIGLSCDAALCHCLYSCSLLCLCPAASTLRPIAPSLRLGPRSSIPAIPAPLANPTSKSATDPSPPPSQCPSLPTTPMRYLPSTAKS